MRHLQLDDRQNGRVVYFSNVQGDNEVAGLDVVEVGYTQAHPGYRTGPWTRNVHTIWVVTEGKLYIKHAGAIYIATAGDVVVIGADTLGEWWSESPDLMSKWWVAIYGVEAYSLIRRLGVDGGVAVFERDRLPSNEPELFSKLYELGGTHPGRRRALFARCCAFFYQIYASILDTTHWEQHAFVQADAVRIAKQHIDMHYSRPLDRKELANLVGFTPQYLSTLFKAQYGVSIQSYLTCVRIRRAKELLEAGLSVKETAASVGYRDANYFSRLFRIQVGCPPTEYRDMVRSAPQVTSVPDGFPIDSMVLDASVPEEFRAAVGGN